MQAVTGVLIQAVVLFGNSILSTIQEDYIRHCFLHSMFQAGQHILLCMVYFAATVLLHGFLQKMARSVWVGSRRGTASISHREPTQLQLLTEEEEGGEALWAQEPYVDDSEDIELPVSDKAMQVEEGAAQEHSRWESGDPKGLGNMLVLSTSLFCLLILLQFECIHASCIMGVCTCTVGSWKRAAEERGVIWLILASAVPALLMLGDVVKAHVGDPSGFTMADAFSSILFPMLVPAGLSWGAKPKTAKQLLMRSAPVLYVLAFLGVLIGLANPDPCASQHIAKWDASLQKDDDGNYITTYRIIVEENTVLLAVVMPAATFITGFVMVRAFVQGKTAELGSVIIAAVCTKYVLVLYGRASQRDAVLALTAMYLSWVTVFGWIVWHLCLRD